MLDIGTSCGKVGGVVADTSRPAHFPESRD